MEVPPKQPSLIDSAAVIAPWAHIKQIRLLRSSIESSFRELPSVSPLHHTFDATATIGQEQKSIQVHVFVKMSAGDLVRIEAEFILEYALDKSPFGEVSDEVATAFGKMTGVYNAWPYWREYVQSTIGRLGLPPLTLPLITHASMLVYYAEKEHVAASVESSSSKK